MIKSLPSPSNPLNIGTRGSPLALAQAHETRDRLASAFSLPSEAFKIVVIKTTGDKITDRPLKEIGGKGLFTKEIEDALLDGRIDLAVHSTKDMPTIQPEGLMLDCYLPREDERDAFISSVYSGIDQLPEGAVVGTSSLRRKAQLLNKRPDLKIVEFRGNLQTRLMKLEQGVAIATFLAMAGLRRLKLDEVPQTPIPTEQMLPAVAQGAICIERRADDNRVEGMLEAIHHVETSQRIAAERAFLKALDGSCETPIAGLANIANGVLTLRGEILSLDGTDSVSGHVSCAIEDGPKAGASLARELLDKAGTGFFDWRV